MNMKRKKGPKRRRPKKKPTKNQEINIKRRNHAKERLMERFGLAMNREERKELEEKILCNNFPLLWKDDEVDVYEVEYLDFLIPTVFNRKERTISTFLKWNMIDNNHYLSYEKTFDENIGDFKFDNPEKTKWEIFKKEYIKWYRYIRWKIKQVCWNWYTSRF